MAGWNLKKGSLNLDNVSNEKLWALFNFVFSESSKKRNTYKFGLIKSILDSGFSAEKRGTLVFIPYNALFGKFAENYWNLIVKYNLKQMRYDGRSEFSKVEQIFRDFVENEPIAKMLDFESLSIRAKQKIINKITKECKQYVLGALYNDTEGYLYSFDLDDSGIYLSTESYLFMMRYKSELEKLNYYAWAKFLEQINEDGALVRLLEKLELSTPKRNDLSCFRQILVDELHEDSCFYCSKKINKAAHVDHFIPWSFIKEDTLWNFVLACPKCNTRKNNRLPSIQYLEKIKNRNQLFSQQKLLTSMQEQYGIYDNERFSQLYNYALLSGIKLWE